MNHSSTSKIEINNNLLLNYLQDRDVPCPTCAYNLRDLQTNHCPECGHSLEVTIRVNDGSMTRWIWAFASSCLSVPLGVLYSVIMILQLLQVSGSRLSIDWQLMIFTGVFFVGTLAAIFLLIRRSSFFRSSVYTQKIIMRLIVGYNFTALAAFVIFVFVMSP